MSVPPVVHLDLTAGEREVQVQPASPTAVSEITPASFVEPDPRTESCAGEGSPEMPRPAESDQLPDETPLACPAEIVAVGQSDGKGRAPATKNGLSKGGVPRIELQEIERSSGFESGGKHGGLGTQPVEKVGPRGHVGVGDLTHFKRPGITAKGRTGLCWALTNWLQAEGSWLTASSDKGSATARTAGTLKQGLGEEKVWGVRGELEIGLPSGSQE